VGEAWVGKEEEALQGLMMEQRLIGQAPSNALWGKEAPKEGEGHQQMQHQQPSRMDEEEVRSLGDELAGSWLQSTKHNRREVR
jgi:hypothetical protein